jgi:nucleotide-binding universal stress UspA family protein
MPIKEILVHMDNSHHCGVLLDVAIGIACRFQARLTGLHVISHPHYKPQLTSVEAASEELGECFRRRAAEAGISADWRCVESAVSGVSVAELVNFHALYKDLVIVGQADHSSDSDSVEYDLPERVVLGAGRPVLIIPYAGTFRTVGEQVMIAWKAGRESTRALHDSLPFLLTAREVCVLSVVPPGEADSGDKEPCAEICAHLASHGIRAEAEEAVGVNIPVGDVLLNHSWEKGCDLLVMGAYTHSARGFVLGSHAKDILRHMTLPVLMAH